MTSYESWLAEKLTTSVAARPVPHGSVHERLFGFQRQIVEWALNLGRASIFAGCGLGKTAMQVEWARWVAAHTGRPVLILAPLAVSTQTIAEGVLLGVNITYVRNADEVALASSPILISNYERLDSLPVESMGGIVLDESSILKAFMGRTKRELVRRCAPVEYRLACTATPAPNDHMEIGNHSEFLGVMQGSDMLTRWFINDTANFGTYRLKGHAVESFWDWVASWAVCCALPSDIGHSDAGYVLPPLRVVPSWVDVDLGRTVQTKDEWKVMLSPTNRSAFIDEGSAWKKVRTVSAAEEVETWDLQVAEDESFTAEGLVVHNCPLQLDLIERCVKLWSNAGDVVFSPFAGIGSEGVETLKAGRRFVGAELKDAYFDKAIGHLRSAQAVSGQRSLSDLLAGAAQ